MKEKLMKELFTLSNIFASPKRILVLEFLKDESIGYTQIAKKFEEENVPIGSSEVYKHLKILTDNGFVFNNYKRYVLTKKGSVALKKLKEITMTKPEIPKIKVKFK